MTPEEELDEQITRLRWTIAVVVIAIIAVSAALVREVLR